MVPIFLFISTFLVYLISHRGEAAHLNYFVPLADAFVHRRLYITDHPAWLNELVKFQGHYYVVYPPMPAIMQIPFVAILGSGFYQPYFSIFLGAINVSLAFLVFRKICDKEISVWMSLLYGFGTIGWFHAQAGSAWYLAHIVALFFLWLMLIEILGRKRLILIGLFIGGAYLSRLPSILSLFFVLVFLKEKFITFGQKGKINFRNLLLLFLGLLPALLFNGLYNFLRFGRFDDYAYTLYLNMQSLSISQSVFPYGFFNVHYFFDRIKDLFFSFPIFISHPPFVIPSMYTMAVYITTPALFLIVFASFRKRLIYSSLIAALIVAIPGLLKGGNGFTQFGFRYSLDFLPFLLILTASGLQNRNHWWSIVLILLSILINAWGVIMISSLNIWGW